MVCEIVKHSHEDYSGSGYPNGLKGYDISIGGRSLGIIDTFDALTHQRVYRDPLDVDTAVKEMACSNIVHNSDPDYSAILKFMIFKNII